MNINTNISAMAATGGALLYNTLRGLETLRYEVSLHKGIVLNVEDFGGVIEISECTFSKNMHFIPELFKTTHFSDDIYDLELFKDEFSTLEFKTAICSDTGVA